MVKRRRERDSDGTTTETAEYNTVFVDTSLDTHLAMLVFKSDTVSDFRKKIVLEHMQCFPKIMDISIHSLKVKHKARFYHLPDSMHVWSAFHGAKGNWFISADASSTSTSHLNQNSTDLGLTKCIAMDVRNVDNSCRGLSSYINKTQQTIPISLPEMISGFTAKNSLEKTADIQNINFSREKRTEIESPFTKKCKMRHIEEDVCCNPSSKDTDALFYASVTDTVMPGVIYCGKPTVDAVKEGLNLCIQQGKPTEVSGLKNDQSVLDNRVAFEGLSVPAVGEKSKLGSNKRNEDTELGNKIPENLMANPKQYELGQDNSAGLMDAQETVENFQDTENSKSETTNIRYKKKKKEANKSANNNIEKSDLLQPSAVDTVVSEKREQGEENQHSASNGLEDIHVVEKSENTDNADKKAKKKRKKKTLTTSDAQRHMPVENQKNGTGENLISFVKSEQDGILEASSQVPSRQSEEKLEENQHSAGKGHEDIHVVEKSENTDNAGKKAKKKRKKKRPTTSDAQRDMPVENQKNGTGENLISFVKSEQDGIRKASFQVPSHQSEEKLEENHEVAVKIDDPARTTKDEGEGINFKEYFVLCEVKSANQASMEMKSLKKVKTSGLPSVSMSTEVQSSSKLSADHESKNKSRFRKEGDSAHNSDSSRRSSRVLENGVKDSSTSEMLYTNLRKPKEIIAESSALNKKNVPSMKSSLEKFPGKSGNKRLLFGLNVNNRLVFKTPKKKSLLTKTGALFKDFSSESSDNENGTAHLSGSIQSPSDSSSISDHAMSESDLNLDSTRNGSSDAQGRSTRGKGTSKLDLLDSEEVTMDMILRSSKRFKKAKLITASQNEADQNESQPIKCVPDSLPF